MGKGGPVCRHMWSLHHPYMMVQRWLWRAFLHNPECDAEMNTGILDLEMPMKTVGPETS